MKTYQYLRVLFELIIKVTKPENFIRGHKH